MSIGPIRSLTGLFDDIKAVVDAIATNVTGLVGNMTTVLARIPTAGRAVSDSVWDSALKATIQNRARVKVQTGYVAAVALSTGAGEDLRYTDVPVTAVSDWQTRCNVKFDGGASTGAGGIEAFSRDGISAGVDAMVCTVRLTSATNLRISCPQDTPTATRIYGRWTVLDYAAAD